MDTSVKAASNWMLTAGDDISKTIQIKATYDDVFIKPTLDEILSDERAILLSQPLSYTNYTPCELVIHVFPRYKIESFSMVCSASKLELFTGTQKEYTETVHGDVITDEADVDCRDQGLNLLSYRYDIEISKSGISEVMIKLLSHSHEICVFGIVLNIAPNPNGITTLLPNAINLDNVQRMLQSSNLKLSPNAEKCKMLMQIYKSAQQPTYSENNSQNKSKSGNNGIVTNAECLETNPSTIQSAKTLQSQSIDLKLYIDARLAELEAKVLAKLDEYEASQSSRLDKILNLLERK